MIELTEQARKELREEVKQALTDERIVSTIQGAMYDLIHEVLDRALPKFEKAILESIGSEVDYEALSAAAKDILKEEIGSKVEDRVRELSRGSMNDDIKREANRIIPEIVRQSVSEVNVHEVLKGALGAKVQEAIDKPVSEIVKQSLGLLYEEFKDLRQSVNNIEGRFNQINYDMENIKRTLGK